MFENEEGIAVTEICLYIFSNAYIADQYRLSVVPLKKYDAKSFWPHPSGQSQSSCWPTPSTHTETHLPLPPSLPFYTEISGRLWVPVLRATYPRPSSPPVTAQPAQWFLYKRSVYTRTLTDAAASMLPRHWPSRLLACFPGLPTWAHSLPVILGDVLRSKTLVGP